MGSHSRGRSRDRRRYRRRRKEDVDLAFGRVSPGAVARVGKGESARIRHEREEDGQVAVGIDGRLSAR